MSEMPVSEDKIKNQAAIFDEIRPYNDEETREALQRMIREPLFFRICKYFFPDQSKEDIISKVNGLKTVMDWQVAFMHPIVNNIVKNTTDGLSWSGFDRLDKKKSYLFISNHRDILLDSAILQVLLYDNGLETSQITFGNNLMVTTFVIDVGKINKMFTVVRETGGKGILSELKFIIRLYPCHHFCQSVNLDCATQRANQRW